MAKSACFFIPSEHRSPPFNRLRYRLPEYFPALAVSLMCTLNNYPRMLLTSPVIRVPNTLQFLHKKLLTKKQIYDIFCKVKI